MYALTEEVVEGDDDRLYIRAEKLDENFIVKVDESGKEQLTESVAFEDAEFVLEGLYNDEDGEFFICLEAVEAEEAQKDSEE